MGYNSVAPKIQIMQGYPVTPADAIGRWTLDGTALDSVGSENITGSMRYAKRDGLLPNPRLYLQQGPALLKQITTANSLKATAITVAGWFYLKEDPAANRAFFGFRGNGTGSANNFAWELGIADTGRGRWRWQNGAKLDNEVLTPGPLPIGRWFHLQGTRDSAQDRARIYLDGALVGEATGLVAHDGGSSQTTIALMSNGTSSYVQGGIAELVVLDVEATPDQANQLYVSSIQVA